MSIVKSIDGIPVTNARRGLELHITTRDCNGGDPKRPSTCAAARAIRRELGAIDCRVHLARVYVRQNKGNWTRYMTPKALAREIVAFDRGGNFQPGTYALPAPTPSKQATGTRQGTKPKQKKGRRTGKRRVYIATQNVRSGPAVGDH